MTELLFIWLPLVCLAAGVIAYDWHTFNNQSVIDFVRGWEDAKS